MAAATRSIWLASVSLQQSLHVFEPQLQSPASTRATVQKHTTITVVILTGYEQHSANVPKGTTVDDRSGPSTALSGGTPDEWGTSAQEMADAAELATGYVFSSFHGCYDGDTFTIQ